MVFKVNPFTGRLDETTPGLSGNEVTSSSSISDNAVVRGDGGARGVQGSGVTIDDANAVSGASQLNVDNLRLDGNTLSSTDANGDINLTPNGSGSVVSSAVDIGGGSIDNTSIGSATPSAGSFTVVDADNLRLDGNTLSSTDANGDINLTPNGSGSVLAANIDVAGDASFSKINVDNLQLDGNTLSATSGLLLVGSVNFSVNGGAVNISGSVDVDNIRTDGNTISSTDTNGDISLSPDGTGTVAVPELTIDPGASGDSFVQFGINSVDKFRLGVDDDDADKWKLSVGSALGTNDSIVVDSTGGKYKGYGSNTSPAAGFIGEVINSNVAEGSAIPVSHGTYTEVTNITLTPGVWDISGVFVDGVQGGGTDPTGNFQHTGVIGTTSASEAGTTQGISLIQVGGGDVGPKAGINGIFVIIPPFRVEVSSNTTYYLNGKYFASGTTGDIEVFGSIRAVRVA